MPCVHSGALCPQWWFMCQWMCCCFSNDASEKRKFADCRKRRASTRKRPSWFNTVNTVEDNTGFVYLHWGVARPWFCWHGNTFPVSHTHTLLWLRLCRTHLGNQKDRTLKTWISFLFLLVQTGNQPLFFFYFFSCWLCTCYPTHRVGEPTQHQLEYCEHCFLCRLVSWINVASAAAPGFPVSLSKTRVGIIRMSFASWKKNVCGCFNIQWYSW